MKASLRKTIVLPIQLEDRFEEVLINVDFDIIDKVERVYGARAEMIAATILADIIRVQRRHVAQIICLWCQGKTKLKQVEISEAVHTSSQKQLDIYIGMIQAAVLWSIRGEDGRPLINDAQFDALVNGEDIEQPEKPEKAAPQPQGTDKTPKKPRAGTSRTRTS